jgi:hypothetical protein
MINLKKAWHKYLIFSVIFSFLSFVFSHLYTYSKEVAENTKVTISLTNYKKPEIVIKNIGKYDIQIDDVISGEWKANFQFFTTSKIKKLDDYLQKQVYKGININNLLTINQLKDIVISPNSKISRDLFTYITEEGTICSFDIPFTFEYSSTSVWADLYLKFLNIIDVIDTKKTIYIRYDGCSYSEIGKSSYENRENEKEQIEDRLNECLKAKRVDLYYKQLYIQNNSNKYVSEITKKLSNLSEVELIKMNNNIYNLIKSNNTGEKANLCFKYMFIFKELRHRSLIQADVNYTSEDFINECINI